MKIKNGQLSEISKNRINNLVRDYIILPKNVNAKKCRKPGNNKDK